MGKKTPEWRLTVRLKGDLKPKVDKAAARDDRTANWYIEKAVEEKLAREQA